jgi:hypothetical protein
MKGISTTLVIIVTAIVILVAALVVLTIFGGGIQPVVDLTTQRNLCIQQGAATCSTTGQMPPTWKVELQYREGNAVVKGTCEDITGCTGCIKNPTTGKYELQGCTVSPYAG